MGSSKDKVIESHLSLISKDLFAGTIAGVVGLAITHPIDTIRIRMQLQTYPKIYKTGFHCGLKTVQREGIRGLFKGVVSNSVGTAPIFSLCFAGKEVASRAIDAWDVSDGLKSYVAGCFGGLVCCITTVPGELMK